MSGFEPRLPVAHLTVGEQEAGMRLDRWLKRRYPGLAMTAIAKLARTGQIRVDGARTPANARLAAGQVVRVPPLPASAAAPAPRERRAAERPLSPAEEAEARSLVLYEDEWVIALAKPPGLPTQGGPGIRTHVDRLAAAFRRDPDDEIPRLVHRLDRETSGVLLLARGAAAAARLAASLRAREAEKIYWAVVAGVPRPPEGVIRAPLLRERAGHGARVRVDAAGRRAETRYALVTHAGRRLAWLKLMPLTGRTHQLRAHLAHIGHPILGDPVYGGRAGPAAAGGILQPGLHLHARRIRIPHPDGSGRILDVSAPLPAHMRALWQELGWDADDPAASAPIAD